MSTHRAIMLSLNGQEEEVRLISAPHRDGYVYATRDGRVMARGATDVEAFAQLTRLAAPASTQLEERSREGVATTP